MTYIFSNACILAELVISDIFVSSWLLGILKQVYWHVYYGAGLGKLVSLYHMVLYCWRHGGKNNRTHVSEF